jgi:hypothetical protein
MIRKLQLLIATCVVLGLTACATPEKQAFNRSANKAIKSLTILEPTPSEGFGINVQNHPGLSFGLIGATVYAAEMQTKSRSLDEAMKPHNWSLTDEFVKQLEAALIAAGYQVKRAKVERERFKLITNYKELLGNSAIKPMLDTDAWLDVQTRDPLYVANSPTADYIPSIGLTARLVASSDQALLYREDLLYGFSFPAGRLEPVVIAADSKYRFANMDALKLDTKQTLAGISEGVPRLVSRIVQDIQHDGLTRPTQGSTPDGLSATPKQKSATPPSFTKP